MRGARQIQMGDDQSRLRFRSPHPGPHDPRDLETIKAGAVPLAQRTAPSVHQQPSYRANPGPEVQRARLPTPEGSGVTNPHTADVAFGPAWPPTSLSRQMGSRHWGRSGARCGEGRVFGVCCPRVDRAGRQDNRQLWNANGWVPAWAGGRARKVGLTKRPSRAFLFAIDSRPDFEQRRAARKHYLRKHGMNMG